nr:MAG TPA: hypothetical protein [Bacteriophage sp.]
MCRTDIPHTLKYRPYNSSHKACDCLHALSTDVIGIF